VILDYTVTLNLFQFLSSVLLLTIDDTIDFTCGSFVDGQRAVHSFSHKPSSAQRVRNSGLTQLAFASVSASTRLNTAYTNSALMSCSSAVPPPYSEASIPSSLSTNCSMGTRFWSTKSGASQRNHSKISHKDSLTHGDLTNIKMNCWRNQKGTSKPKFCSSCVGLDPYQKKFFFKPN